MAKFFMLIDPARVSKSKQSKVIVSTNWEVCALCQKDTGNALQCPGIKIKPVVGSGYQALAINLNECQKFRYLPMEIDLERLDNGSGIEATLETNLAVWHKTCFFEALHSLFLRSTF